MSKRSWARATLGLSAFIGIFRHHLGQMVAVREAGPWQARRESDLRRRCGQERRRAEGAGLRHELVFTARVLVTLAVLPLQIPHAALAHMYDVHRSTVTRAVREKSGHCWPGGITPPRKASRLSTLTDVFAYAAASGITLRTGGSEIQVRCPPAHPSGRLVSCPARRR